MLFAPHRLRFTKNHGRISILLRTISFGCLLAILCLFQACINVPEARMPNGINPGMRVAVIDTLYLYPDSTAIDYRQQVPDTLWHDTTAILSNGTVVSLALRWIAGTPDTMMRYIPVDSGQREYAIIRNDTVFHETALYLPGTRIDTLRFLNAALQVKAQYGNTDKVMTLSRREMFIVTRRMIPGILSTCELPSFRTTWNNRWLIWTMNLNGNQEFQPLLSLIWADLNTGILSIQRQYSHISTHTLVPATDPTGTWLHTGMAVWTDPLHPIPMPARMAMYMPDACWVSDTSFMLFIPASNAYTAYFSYTNGLWTLIDSAPCPIPDAPSTALCPDYNNDMLWICGKSDSLLGIGFQKSIPVQWIPLKGVSVTDWNNLMLPVIVFQEMDGRSRIRLDIRGKIAYFVSDT